MPATPMTVEAYAKKTYLNLSQRNELRESRHRNEMALQGLQPDGRPLPAVTGLPPHDLELLRENLRREESMLESGTPPKLTPLEARQRYLWMKELEDDIKRGMPSYEQMERPHPANIDTHVAWERHGLKNILAWKAVRRELDPDNEEPNFTNVELLRSTQLPTVDLRQYWQRFDLIQWGEGQEEDLQQPIDDETWQRFVLLKAQEWAPTNIQRELGWDKGQYDQALARLRGMMASEEATNGHAGPVPIDPADDAATDPPLLAKANGATPKSLSDPAPIGWRAFGTWLDYQIRTREFPIAAVARAGNVSPAYLQGILAHKTKVRDALRMTLITFFAACDQDATHIKQFLKGQPLRDWLEAHPDATNEAQAPKPEPMTEALVVQD